MKTFRKFLTTILLAMFVFVVSGVGVLSQPKPAEAIWNLDKIVSEQANHILVAIWKFAIFPLLKRLVLQVAKGDFDINGQQLLNWFVKDLAFQSLQATLMEYTGFSLCTDIRMNVRTAFTRAGMPGNYVPHCTFDKSTLNKAITVMDEIFSSADPGQTAITVGEREFTKRFALSIQDSGNDFNQWFGLRTNAAEQQRKAEQNYRFELLINQGMLGSRDCAQVKKDSTKKTAAAKGKTKATKSASSKTKGKKPLNKQKDCRIKTPGLYFAEYVKGQESNLKKGTINAQVVQDIAALSALTIDTVLETWLTGVMSAVSGSLTGTTQSPETTGTSLQKSGQNRPVTAPFNETTN